MGVRPEPGKAKILVVGAGLAGTVAAVHLARRGHAVEIYERHADPRLPKPPPSPEDGAGGRTPSRPTINLTICARGFRALDAIGAGDIVREHAVPVYGRVVHDTDQGMTFQPYGNAKEAIHSIRRVDLVNLLLDFAEHEQNLRMHFDERCLEVNLAEPFIETKNMLTGVTARRTADRLIGADGVFSAIRSQIQRTDRFTLSQQYLDCGYREMTAPRRDPRGWTKERNALHFWPRGNCMLMAAPNSDGSFTVSLYMPFEGPVSFDSIRTEQDLRQLFRAHFPDALDELPNLAEEYFSRLPSPLVTVRCAPWTYKDKVTLLGDAAHAIVPFYGQGANSAFEDGLVLGECLDRHGDDWGAALSEYERIRKPNTDVIADLSIQNFTELQERIGDRAFLLRKRIERRVNLLRPDCYVPLYLRVTLGTESYVDAVKKEQEERWIIDHLMNTRGIEAMGDDELDALITRTLADAPAPGVG